MQPPVLTASTISYLFASEWAPASRTWPVDVPGAEADGPETAGNLLNVAIWRLLDKQVVDIEYVRPLEVEDVGVFRKPSFARLRLADPGVTLPGLQGALLWALRQATGDEARGVRQLVLALDLNWNAPWASVTGHCLAEATTMGVADLGGKRWHPVRRPVITNPAAYEALRPVHEQIGAERRAYRERAQELDNAVLADCLHGLYWAHTEPR